MNCTAEMLRLYAVTDRAWVGEQTLPQQVEAALKGGATCVQLREKIWATRPFWQRRWRSPPSANDTVCRSF